jgi:hypothetical protein
MPSTFMVPRYQAVICSTGHFTTPTALHGEMRSNRSSRWRSACSSKKPLEVWGLALADADVLSLVRVHYRPVSSQVTMYADTIDTLVEVRRRGLKVGLRNDT